MTKVIRCDKKLFELNVKCGICPTVEFCNNYADTPPCCQPRLEDLPVQKFLSIVDYIQNRSLWDEDEED